MSMTTLQEEHVLGVLLRQRDLKDRRPAPTCVSAVPLKSRFPEHLAPICLATQDCAASAYCFFTASPPLVAEAAAARPRRWWAAGHDALAIEACNRVRERTESGSGERERERERANTATRAIGTDASVFKWSHRAHGRGNRHMIAKTPRNMGAEWPAACCRCLPSQPKLPTQRGCGFTTNEPQQPWRRRAPWR